MAGFSTSLANAIINSTLRGQAAYLQRAQMLLGAEAQASTALTQTS